MHSPWLFSLLLAGCLLLQPGIRASSAQTDPPPVATSASADPIDHQFTDTVKIGVLAFRGKEKARQRWRATADFLSRSVADAAFSIVPLTLEEMEYAVRHSEIDFTITNSGHYITLAAHYGVSRLVTLNALGPSSAENLTGSVIFTRADRSDITSLKDLPGKSFLSVAPQAFCFQSAWREMHQQGVDPHKDFSRLQFAGFPQDSIAIAVKQGRVDAGNVRTGVLEEMAAEGKIKLSDFRILAPQKPEGFTYMTTTRVYPEWPFVKLKDTDKQLAQKVAIALLSMPPDSDAARLGHYAGWTVPLDYSSVQDLFRTLKIGPYAGLSELTLHSIFERYKAWIITAVLLLLTSLLWAARTERVVKRRTAELARVNEALEDQINERQRIEEIARQRRAELARVAELNSMGELASGIAHELNHPLATISNYATGCIRKLRSGSDNREETLDILQRVSDQATRASQIIRGLRDSMRGGKGERHDSDLNQIVHDVSDLLEFNLRNSDAKLNLELAENLPAVHVDPVQIEQVLLNLTGNAIEAIKAADPDKRQIAIHTRSDENNQVIVSVEDTGPGVPTQIHGKIFHPFVSNKNEGMGLGLSISCSIIKDHGGQLWLQSSSTQGSEFRFSLPTRGDDVRR